MLRMSTNVLNGFIEAQNIVWDLLELIHELW